MSWIEKLGVKVFIVGRYGDFIGIWVVDSINALRRWQITRHISKGYGLKSRL